MTDETPKPEVPPLPFVRIRQIARNEFHVALFTQDLGTHLRATKAVWRRSAERAERTALRMLERWNRKHGNLQEDRYLR